MSTQKPSLQYCSFLLGNIFNQVSTLSSDNLRPFPGYEIITRNTRKKNIARTQTRQKISELKLNRKTHLGETK